MTIILINSIIIIFKSRISLLNIIPSSYLMIREPETVMLWKYWTWLCN
jgi:hypothetical protein